jgi:exosortase A
MSAVTLPLRSPAWLRFAPLALLLAAVFWLFRDTARDMVGIWLRSDTFAHALLVPPVSLWLAWRRRHELAGLPVRPMPWLLLPMLAACLLWLLGGLAAVDAASQFALVSLVVLSVPALLGWAITRVLLFPLAFLFFAVPFGQFLAPPLIDYTADFTVAALRLTGIPVHREGNNFIIPSGTWSVIEACSGVRYLIASVMVGTLFAYLNYRSLRRRLMFIGVSIVVPLVANWVRAYMIVMIGHLSNNKLAVGVDHLIYGWVFFGVVIALMFTIGMRWSEPEIPPSASIGSAAAVDGSPVVGWAVVGAAVALMVGTQAWLARLDATSSPRPVALVPLASLGEKGELPFIPSFQNPAAQLTLVKPGEPPVWLWVGYYPQSSEDSKLVSSMNRLVGRADKERWTRVGRGERRVTTDLGTVTVRTGILAEAAALHVGSPRRLRVWQLYWVGGRFVASDAQAKLWQAFDRLRGGDGEGAVLLLAAPQSGSADAALEAYLAPRLREIGKWLESVPTGR